MKAKSWSVSTEESLEMEVPSGAAGGLIRIPDIPLKEPMPWYTGIVVNASGDPVNGASVNLKLVEPMDHTQRVSIRASTQTDTNGEFWLPAPDRFALGHLGESGRTLQLEARALNLNPASMAPGVEPVAGLRLVLRPMREVSVVVQDPGPLAETLIVVARRVDGAGSQPRFLGRWLGSAGFRGYQPAGTWTVALHPERDSELPLVETPPLQGDGAVEDILRGNPPRGSLA